MAKTKKSSIEVQGTSIAILSHERQDFLCLTDIAKLKNPDHSDDVIRNWLRSRSTVEFLGVWERLNNPGFNPVEFDGIRIQTGLSSFVLTPKQWIEKTGAIGLRSSAGRYGGTYAHKDIAFEFASWVSVEFKLYLIKEFQRLKDEENDRLKLGWSLQRTLAKINYRIHTDAIKETLLPPLLTKAQTAIVYANEADLLNVALFGQTARAWRDAHPEAEGNIRDHAPLEQLVVLTNLESLNAVFIRQGLPQPERLRKLNEIAISQMKTLLAAGGTPQLNSKNP
jgi:hypothetical protein